MFKKIYDPKGSRKIHFSVGDEERLRKFTGEEPSKFEIVDDPLFKKAYVVPCRIEYEKRWDI